MSDRETLPINHSTGSHVIHAAGGAASGALKGGLAGIGTLWGLSSAIVAATAGALVGFGVFGAGGLVAGLTAAAIGGGIAAVAIPVLAVIPFTAPIIWGGVMPIAAAIGAGLGGLFGIQHGHEQVQRDRAAAHMVDAEVGAMQAQAAAMQAQAQMMAQTRQGAPSTVFADSIQHQGRAAELLPELATAR